MMKTYKTSFNGRQAGALGITYRIETTVKAEDADKAALKLYDKYEHINHLNIKEVNND